jgi:(p)ppGpp synthase/HD superfamily hydrolase
MEQTQVVNFEDPVKQKVFLFAVTCHGSQTRKWTGEPYWQHLLNVSNILNKVFPDNIEYFTIAMLHDVLEDAACTKDELLPFLASLGMDQGRWFRIYQSIIALTDQYTPENYPKLNRAKRKEFEARKLAECSSMVQTVKYADLLDNLSSIIQHDMDFAVVYVKEVKQIVHKLQNTNVDLLIWLCHDLYHAEQMCEMYQENKKVDANG